MAILTELRDPRIKGVTVLGAEVPKDLRSAKVIVSVMGEAKHEKLAMQGLESAVGFLQRKVGNRLDLRFVPVLSFKLDRGLKNAAETSRLLHELQEREGPLASGDESDEPDNSSASDEPDDTSLADADSGESVLDDPDDEPEDTAINLDVRAQMQSQPAVPPQAADESEPDPDDTAEYDAYDPPNG